MDTLQSLPDLNFDIAVLHGFPGGYPQFLQKLRIAQKKYVQYYNVHHIQPQILRGEWDYNVYCKYLHDTLAVRWGAILRDANGDTLYYRYYAEGGRRPIIDYTAIDSVRATQWAKFMVTQTPDGVAFFDVAWPLAEWQIHPSSGRWDRVTTDKLLAWDAGQAQFFRIVKKEFKHNTRYIRWGMMPNGPLRVWPGPIYIENAGLHPDFRWQDCVSVWRQNPHSVLSTQLGTVYADSLVDLWRDEGGSIAFTYTSEAGRLEEREMYKSLYQLRHSQ
jgi:hypothetical protein